MRAALRLPLDFEPAGFQRDLAQVLDEAWTGHFNADLYRGDWSGIALRAPQDATHAIDALHNAPGATQFADLPVLERCPHFRAVTDRLACELSSVRLLRLGPGAVIEEHTDHELGYEFGEARLHVPVCTNPAVDFRVDGERLEMRPGELWYIDASRPHAVRNGGSEARVHLVIDCRVNAWLDELLRAADALAVPRPPAEATISAPEEPATGWPLESRYSEPVTGRIIDFIRGIGLEVGTRDLPQRTFLPGILVERGEIWVDPRRLHYPGDLLHEAGHIAVTSAADRAMIKPDARKDAGAEMMAIAWSWAALTYLGLDPAEVFHPEGYKGDAQWLIETYAAGKYIALPMLQWIGLAADPARAVELGVAPYPHMLRWLRD